MGTKNNPSQFDCYANAAGDEPMFVLLGRDPTASLIVKIWVAIRREMGDDEAKLAEANACADALLDYAKGLGKGQKIIAAVKALENYGGIPEHRRPWKEAGL